MENKIKQLFTKISKTRSFTVIEYIFFTVLLPVFYFKLVFNYMQNPVGFKLFLLPESATLMYIILLGLLIIPYALVTLFLGALKTYSYVLKRKEA